MGYPTIFRTYSCSKCAVEKVKLGTPRNCVTNVLLIVCQGATRNFRDTLPLRFQRVSGKNKGHALKLQGKWCRDLLRLGGGGGMRPLLQGVTWIREPNNPNSRMIHAKQQILASWPVQLATTAMAMRDCALGKPVFATVIKALRFVAGRLQR